MKDGSSVRVEDLVRPEEGWVDRRVFSDPDVYELEQERIFSRSWLLLGHESMVANPGDYIATHMGEDPVILCRGEDGQLRAFLNSCRHRGNMVCLFESGKAESFTCSYHGWRYGLDGALKGVPYINGAYYNDLDTEKLGLVPVPRLEFRSGLIFGSWNEQVVKLEDYLGPAAWYLDNLVLADWGGGLEVISGPHGYKLHANWKIIAENNAGDHYHTLFTHKSLFRLGYLSEPKGQGQPENGPFEVAMPGGHGIGGVRTGDEAFSADLAKAHRLGLGSHVEDYVRDRHKRMREALQDCPANPYTCTHGNIFPNFSFSGHGGALAGRGMYVLQPRGPLLTETWQLVVVEKDAPDEVKELAVREMGAHGQLASGLFAQDDMENFERVTQSSRFRAARSVPFHLGMGLSHEGNWPGQEDWNTRGLPGVVGPRFSEHNQRGMYDTWRHYMTTSKDGGA